MIGRLAITVILPVVAAVAVLGARAPTAQAGSGMSSSGSAVVRTSDGLIRGVVSANHRTFSGIQYAAAPWVSCDGSRPGPSHRGVGSTTPSSPAVCVRSRAGLASQGSSAARTVCISTSPRLSVMVL